jgi:hypothetical protein
VDGTGKKWLVGCGIGCGAAILLVVLISVGGSLYLMKPLNKAIESQTALIDAFGERQNYIPPPQGITVDRLEMFLTIRRQLMPMCEEFTKMGDNFAAMDELDQGGEDPSKSEVFKAMGQMMGGIGGMLGNIGRFTELRNQILLENGMGLGEYIWIYVLAYNSWQGHVPNIDFDDDSGGTMSSAERKVMRTLIAHHAEALTAAGRADEAALWEREIGRMKRSETGIPFRDGELPPSVIRAFLPYEAELESLYCAPMSGFEMNRLQKRGMSFTSS